MLARFLQVWLGAWPPHGPGITVVGHPARDKPRWDGAEQLMLGVTDAQGRGVLSVPPAHRDRVAALLETEPPEPLEAVESVDHAALPDTFRDVFIRRDRAGSSGEADA